jgi:ABC-type Fe3+-hydroxamate transport system, periplasmic component
MERNTYKLTITVVLILIGASLAVVFSSSTSSMALSNGIIVDFGGRDITYSDVDTEEMPDAFSALQFVCDKEGFDLVLNGNEVITIDSLPGTGSPDTWGLYVTPIGKTGWEKTEADPLTILITDFSAVAWGLFSEDKYPTPAVDGSGVNFYNYDQPRRTISLAPSCTETLCSVGGVDTIVGTDQYSNYPFAVAAGQAAGKITIVGGFTNPSYELIVQQRPDMVICIASQVSHLVIAEKLRNVGIDVIVTFDGEDIGTVLDNIYMVGTGIGYTLTTERTLSEITEAMDMIQETLNNHFQIKYPDVMVALSAVKSPWVSGANTYISDILTFTYSENVYSAENGWVQVNSESIMQYNPSAIIVVGSEYLSEDDYERFMDSLPAEWKNTGAYRTGEIYVLSEITADVASRPGPRIAQLTELTARILHPDAFSDGITVPKCVGYGYEYYLTITKDLDYNGGI